MVDTAALLAYLQGRLEVDSQRRGGAGDRRSRRRWWGQCAHNVDGRLLAPCDIVKAVEEGVFRYIRPVRGAIGLFPGTCTAAALINKEERGVEGRDSEKITMQSASHWVLASIQTPQPAR